MKPVAVLIFIVHTSLQISNLAFWALLVVTFGLVKLVIPHPFVRKKLLDIMHFFYLAFGKVSVRMICLFNNMSVETKINGSLSKTEWYLIVANHLSYLDIVLLIEFSINRIPAPKFFLKKELIWLPFVGIAAWALDMPFMRRYSRAQVAKNPSLKGKDIETTRKSCEKYKHSPTTVINFVEGTRFTAQKHTLKNSPYRNLLPPKAGGIAFTLASMGNMFTDILDVTLVYPDNPKHPMVAMLSGEMKRIIIDVDIVPLPENPENLDDDYFNNESYRIYFQNWVNNLWRNKDARLTQLSR